ncbi:MAG: cytidine deaminase [Pleurocapsa sp.]
MSQQPSITEEQKQQLIAIARQALVNAYAPYSQFRVGAALLTEQGNIYSGCNVENVSYGLSMCAERNAIATAVAAEGGEKMKIKAIAVANDRSISCSPCGACRQVINEFGDKSVVIFWQDRAWQTKSAIELLPTKFSF